MAHNINYNEARNTHSFYSLKEIPWHGLGQIVETAVTPKEAMVLANLDYTVKMADMFASYVPLDVLNVQPVANDPTKIQVTASDGSIYISPRGVKVPDIYSTYRSDNFDILGTVGKRYEVVQNEAALEFIYNVVNHNDIIDPANVIIQTAGALGKGERIFVTAKLPSDVISVNGISEDHDNYIVFTTSHDGSSSIQAMFTSIRVVCNNTLNAAIGSTKNLLSFRDTRNVKDSLKAGSIIMQNHLEYANERTNLFREAANVSVTEEDIIKYVSDIFIRDVEARHYFTKQALNKQAIDSNIVSTKAMNVINSVYDTIHNGIGQDNNKNTAYWLYNGVISYLNNTISYDSKEDKLNSFIKGTSFAIGQRAMHKLIELAS